MADTQQQSESRESLDPRTFFEQWEGTDSIQTDRFCLHCGYNLRGQMIRRDPMTKLLVYRCSECGHFYSANETVSWIDRFAARFGKGVVGKTSERIIAQVKPTGGLPKELSILLGVLWSGLVLAVLVGACVVHSLIIVSIVQEIGSDLMRSGRQLDQHDLYAFLVVLCFGAGAWSFIVITVTVLILPHWKKKHFIWYACILPMPGTITALFVGAISAVPIVSWISYRLSPAYAFAAIAGGLIAVRNGRALLRGLVRVVVPPRWHGPVAFLWTADGLSPPFGDLPTEQTS